MAGINDFVVPDRLYEVPIVDGILRLSPSVDFLHYFQNGAWLLKYWNDEGEPPSFCNVFLEEQGADFLIRECGIEVLYRRKMASSEHQLYLGWASTHLTDLDFDIPEEE